jgi:hypothetical protein
MRRMILRMIATGSLSAFSSAALPGLPSQQARGPGGAGGAVHQARAGQVEPPPQPAPQLLLDPGKANAPSNSGRVPPRGSLLDLSV